MSNSLGVSRRCMKAEIEPSPPPITMPMSSITWMLAYLPDRSQPYRATDRATMSATWRMNWGRPVSAISPAAPRK